ncbi:MAG: DUF4010 domain-containing protein [Bryobacteraceae bacterium]|nr:DUF4010 domain-containing protein [Bryobacteraceae bacterium]
MNGGNVFINLAIALGLGLLVGLERERAASQLAGFRTFAAVTLFGSVSAMLATTHGAWVLPSGLLALGAVIAAANLLERGRANRDPGITTEVALFAMYGIGALVMTGPRSVAVALGGALAALLAFKGEMHGFARGLSDNDVKAIMRFVLISLVILPALPDQNYGPFQVWNPRQIWWMVVLIVGISLAGYIAFQVLGQRGGTVLGGLLGGLVSSTATTVSYARASKAEPATLPAALMVILLASGVVFGRVLVEMAVISRELLHAALIPVLILAALLFALAGIAWFRQMKQSAIPKPENPAELKPALLFAAGYAVVLAAAAATRHYFGEGALFFVAAISGLTDVDAITLSTANLVSGGTLSATTGWKLVITAVLSNLVFKAAVVAWIGHASLFRWVAASYLVVFAAGLVLLWLW